MFGTLGKFWRSLIRYPLLVLLGGVVVGVPIGWCLASRSTIEQIPLAPVKATAYAKLSSEELKIKSDQMVTAIRGLVRSYYDEDRRMRTAADENSGKTDSSAELERLRNAWLAESAKLHDMFIDRYKTNYWADALLLREAIVAKVGGVPGAQNPNLFQHPTNILGVVQVADSLDLLGKALSAGERTKP